MYKVYTYAGVSKKAPNFNYVFRVATNTRRITQLYKLGDTKIDIIPLLKPMSKKQAADYLLKINFDNEDNDIRQCLLNVK